MHESQIGAVSGPIFPFHVFLVCRSLPVTCVPDAMVPERKHVCATDGQTGIQDVQVAITQVVHSARLVGGVVQPYRSQWPSERTITIAAT